MNALEWVHEQPWLWRDTTGRYAILYTVLPEARLRPTGVYHLRKIDPASGKAYPGTLGYLLSERYTLGDAQGEAERDAYCDAHAAERSVPEDYPSLLLARFFWPISQGTTKAALAVVREGDRLLARVVGMARREDPFEPVTYAEIDLSEVAVPSTSREGERP